MAEPLFSERPKEIHDAPDPIKSINPRYVDALLGKERPIGTREIAMFTTAQLGKDALRRGGGVSSVFADLISARTPVYESIETLRLRPEQAKNRRIFWGKPQ